MAKESKSDTVINEEERVFAYKTTHDSVSLRWRAIKDAQGSFQTRISSIFLCAYREG